jgi:hypothetical protein
MEKWLGSIVWFKGKKGVVDEVDGWDFPPGPPSCVPNWVEITLTLFVTHL